MQTKFKLHELTSKFHFLIVMQLFLLFLPAALIQVTTIEYFDSQKIGIGISIGIALSILSLIAHMFFFYCILRFRKLYNLEYVNIVSISKCSNYMPANRFEVLLDVTVETVSKEIIIFEAVSWLRTGYTQVGGKCLMLIWKDKTYKNLRPIDGFNLPKLLFRRFFGSMPSDLKRFPYVS